MKLLSKLREKRKQRAALKEFRSNLYVGQRVFVDNGAYKANVQIVSLINESVRVINQDMNYAAYPVASIYPVEQ